jgi:hypothetical protein
VCITGLHTRCGNCMCTLHVHTEFAHQICTPVVHTEYAHGFAHWMCTPDLHTQWGTPDVHTGFANRVCTPDVCAHLMCTQNVHTGCGHRMSSYRDSEVKSNFFVQYLFWPKQIRFTWKLRSSNKTIWVENAQNNFDFDL